MHYIKRIKKGYDGIENIFLKKTIKTLAIGIGLYLISSVLFLALPQWAVITDEELSFLANEVKKELFLESDEISLMYEEKDIIFTLNNYSYRKPYKDRNKKIAGYGNFEYSIKKNELYLDVTWETNDIGSIDIISIKEVIK